MKFAIVLTMFLLAEAFARPQDTSNNAPASGNSGSGVVTDQENNSNLSNSGTNSKTLNFEFNNDDNMSATNELLAYNDNDNDLSTQIENQSENDVDNTNDNENTDENSNTADQAAAVAQQDNSVNPFDMFGNK